MQVCPDPDKVIIIVSSLMKDMNSKTELYRANAIRVLCSITDSQILAQIERYLKQVGFTAVHASITMAYLTTSSGWSFIELINCRDGDG